MKSRKLAFLLILILILSAVSSSRTAESLDDSACEDYELIFARGSGQAMNDSDFRAVKEKIGEKLDGFKVGYYELGRNSNGYKAISVDFNMALGAYVSAGKSYKFSESIESGVKELISHYQAEQKRCKNKKFILAGYSQGALVIDKSLDSLNPEKIIYVGNFGDPKLYLPEGNKACQKIGLSSYRVYVPDCNVEEGILGGIKPYQPAGYFNKLGVWCNINDFMCGSSLNLLDLFGGHTSYDKKDGYEKFASIVLEKITNKKTEKTTEARYSDARKRDIVVVFDHLELSSSTARANEKTINDDLKEELVALANHGTRIAIYNLYSLTDPTLKLKEMVPFTNDDLGEKIDELNYKNSQYLGYVFTGSFNDIYHAIKNLSASVKWADGSERNLFILTDVAHDNANSFDGTTISDAIKAARKNDVKVSFLSSTGREDNMYYKKLADSTEGQIIGNDYSKILLNQNLEKHIPTFYSKTYNINKNSDFTLFSINGLTYGISKNKTITIMGLDDSCENIISFVSFNKNGKKVSRNAYIIRPKKIKAPDTGTSY